MENFNDFSEKTIFRLLQEIKEINDTSVDVPVELDILPESKIEVYRYGFIEDYKKLNHKQGEVKEFQGTCGIVSCECVLKQFGITDMTEEKIVKQSVENNLCEISEDCNAAGGTTVFNQRDILSLNDIPAHVELQNNYESLASYIEQGKGVILEVNAGVLWDEPAAYQYGQPNHAIVVIGYARNRETGIIEGLYINDSGRGYASDSGRFISTEILDDAFLNAGGLSVITEISQ